MFADEVSRFKNFKAAGKRNLSLLLMPLIAPVRSPRRWFLIRLLADLT